MKKELTKEMALAIKIIKQTRNKLFLEYKALSPALYRMKVLFVEDGDIFGTDAQNIYVNPMSVILRYKESSDKFLRTYLHMIFHCIYLHPFVNKKNVDLYLWNIAVDICAESAVMKLERLKTIDGDNERQYILDKLKNRIKKFFPEIVYYELSKNGDNYDIEKISELFHMDNHLWLTPNKQSDGDSEDSDSSGNSSKSQDGPNDGSSKSKDNSKEGSKSNSGGQNNNSSSNTTSIGQNMSNENKKEWSEVSTKVATDFKSFNQGTVAGDAIQDIEYLTKDKMDYEEFLRAFSTVEEVMKLDEDQFDYMYYTYGLNGIKTPGSDNAPKKVLMIEPLEYKEDKVVKDFVIAIDTSGSCSGSLVKKFLNKTYSILKETESFSKKVNIHIIQCDASVQNDTKITSMEEMEDFMQNMKLYGFGGTDFRPVFKYVDELIQNKEFTNLCGLIYFTDGYGTFPTTPTLYKTVFAFLEDFNNRDNVPDWAMSVYWNDDES